jgi:hypothetical protein
MQKQTAAKLDQRETNGHFRAVYQLCFFRVFLDVVRRRVVINLPEKYYGRPWWCTTNER